MESKLTSQEKSILQHICNRYKKKYPSITEHLNQIVVVTREITGIGLYLKFEYDIERLNPITEEKDILLSPKELLYIQDLESPVSCEVNLTDGYFDFLEIVSNDGVWDGVVKEFFFEDENV